MRAMNVSGKMLPRFIETVNIETDRPEFSLRHFACKGGQSLTLLRGNLLACKQGLRKLQPDPVQRPPTDSRGAK